MPDEHSESRHVEDDTEKAAACTLRTVPGSTEPTLSAFIAHAERYGTEEVLETAQSFLSATDLTQLLIELTRIDEERKRRFGDVPTRRLTREQKLIAVKLMSEQGIPQVRIGTHLGLSERQVRRLQRELRQEDGEKTASEAPLAA